MIHLLFAILSSAMVAIVMRLAQPRVDNPTALLASNYIMCTLAALILSAPELPAVSLEAVGFPAGLGAVNGLIYLAGFALMQYNTRQNGVVLSSIFMKLGVLISTLISVIWFRETPTALQMLGFVLAVAAIIIIHYRKGASLNRGSWGLLLMLCMSGLGDGMSKVYEEYGNPGFQNLFLMFTFLSALILCLGWMVSKKEHLGWKELGFGVLLGVPNFLSSLFLPFAHNLPKH